MDSKNKILFSRAICDLLSQCLADRIDDEHLAQRMQKCSEWVKACSKEKKGGIKPDDPTNKEISETFEYWKKTTRRPRALLTADRRTKIKARLKNFSVSELKEAIDVSQDDPFVQGANDRGKRYDFVKHLFRNDEKVEELLDKRRSLKEQAGHDPIKKLQLNAERSLRNGDTETYNSTQMAIKKLQNNDSGK